jgi:hypothetical protein
MAEKAAGRRRRAVLRSYYERRLNSLCEVGAKYL